MLAPGSPGQPYACTNTHTQTVTWFGRSTMLAIYQFLSIFTCVIFVQNTMNHIWMKRKLSPLYNKKYFNLTSLTVWNSRQKCKGGYHNFGPVTLTLLSIILFHVLGQAWLLHAEVQSFALKMRLKVFFYPKLMLPERFEKQLFVTQIYYWLRRWCLGVCRVSKRKEGEW